MQSVAVKTFAKDEAAGTNIVALVQGQQVSPTKAVVAT